MASKLKTKEKFEVFILWGSPSYLMGANDKPSHYDFGSQEELDAFLKGVDEATGFLECDIRDEYWDPDSEIDNG